MYRESKAELTDRLRREGRFDAFKARREAMKGQGMAPKDAWRAAAEEFPPQGLARVEAFPGAEDLPAGVLEVLKAKGDCNIAKAIRWVFDAIGDPSIKPTDAPSTGAWSLLAWARSSAATRGQFYAMYLPKLLAKADRGQGADNVQFDGKGPTTELLERIMAARRERESASPPNELTTVPQ
jgi:hypothetical protein